MHECNLMKGNVFLSMFCSKDEPYEDEHFHSYDYEGPGDSEADITVAKEGNWVMGCKLFTP